MNDSVSNGNRVRGDERPVLLRAAREERRRRIVAIRHEQKLQYPVPTGTGEALLHLRERRGRRLVLYGYPDKQAQAA